MNIVLALAPALVKTGSGQYPPIIGYAQSREVAADPINVYHAFRYARLLSIGEINNGLNLIYPTMLALSTTSSYNQSNHFP